ncbi:MAG: SIS domain-containing protein [Phycisphaera sp.]|nr:SIS domain-containing protein [Phycisphaera sp.]
MIASKAQNALRSNIEALQHLLDHIGPMAEPLGRAAQIMAQTLTGGGKLLCCGNGGSAADSAHFSAEIAGRYVLERAGFPAIDLTADHSLVTALINDYPPEQVFARQVQALGASGDVLAVFTTSGNSTNVRMALEVAGAKNIKTIAFLGRDGGKCKGLADVELIVPSQTTARIQEIHQLLFHTLCEAVDPVLAGRE